MYIYPTTSNEIFHYGIKRRSGRYPWGSGENPYQDLGGKRRVSSKELRREEALERNKDVVLQKGRATDVAQYRGRLTNQELNNVYTRLNLEKNIQRMADEENRPRKSTIEKTVENIKTVTEWTIIGVTAYNLAANIYNSTPTGKAKPLVVVPLGKKK